MTGQTGPFFRPSVSFLLCPHRLVPLKLNNAPLHAVISVISRQSKSPKCFFFSFPHSSLIPCCPFCLGEGDGLGLAKVSDPLVLVDGPHGEVVLVAALELSQRARHRQRKRLHVAHLLPQRGRRRGGTLLHSTRGYSLPEVQSRMRNTLLSIQINSIKGCVN